MDSEGIWLHVARILEAKIQALFDHGKRVLRDEEVARIKTAVADKLRQRREALGMSKNALAQAAGIAVQTVSFIESGTNSPSVSTFVRLCSVLKVNPGEILEDAGGD